MASVNQKVAPDEADLDSADQLEEEKRKQKFKKAKMNYQPKFKFGRSFENLTMQEVISFVDANQENHDFVRNHFDLDGIDWFKILRNSISKTDNFFDQYTDFGKPLL